METILGIARTSMLMGAGVFYFVKTCLRVAIVDGNPRALLDTTNIRTASFANLWKSMGHMASQDLNQDVIDVLKQAEGNVLDLGSGTGAMLFAFDASKIKTIYCIEPSVAMHSELHRNAQEQGLADKLQIVTCGAQQESLLPALTQLSLLSNNKPTPIFDSIVCCRVLCGVPQQADTVKGLFSVLKPGGRMLIYEHVVNPYQTAKGSYAARAVQRLFSLLGWTTVMDGCELERDTFRSLREVGGKDAWKDTNLWTIDPASTLPFLAGFLVKKQ